MSVAQMLLFLPEWSGDSNLRLFCILKWLYVRLEKRLVVNRFECLLIVKVQLVAFCKILLQLFGICKKLVYRHPHVFGTVQADTSEQVLVNWEVLKRKEKGQQTTADAVEAVAHTLPALWRAEKIQKKTAKVGFQWNSVSGALDKLEEEVAELRQAVESGIATDAPHGIREEVGDALFIAAKIAQMSGVDPEDALHRACDKYNTRFRRVEESVGGKPLTDYTEEELVALWRRAKEQES